jgi:spermidine synthase
MSVFAKKYYSVIFILLLISGFCGLLYQIVWIRLAFTAFGIITPVLSVVISVFMLGLAIGSWAGGRYIAGLINRTGWSAIVFYGFMEFLVGIGGLIVPYLFSFGQTLLLPAGDFDSFKYLFFSAVILGTAVLPWCLFMGATIPFMMAFVRQFDCANKRTFSYLYLANVVGAMCGTVATAGFLIEIMGLHHTLLLAACLNFAVAITSLVLNFQYPCSQPAEIDDSSNISGTPRDAIKSNIVISILFMTGFTSMAMEVVWTRAFTPVLRTTVYSFAAILVVYLLATWLGSWLYRKHAGRQQVADISVLIMYLTCFCILPVVAADPRILWINKIAAVLSSIFPFCFALGYLTSKLMDESSQGDPKIGGRAYAINTLGCILGPLFAGYLLLPVFGVRFSQVLLTIPYAVFFVYYFRNIFVVIFLGLLFGCTQLFLSYEDGVFYRSVVVRRDYVATVIAHGEKMKKSLLVNGVGMTSLTPILKYMAHFPLAIRNKKPKSSLVICLGMGATFRSAVSWGTKTTAVELVPSVRDAFGFFFEDADEILKKPNAEIIIDDGRRFLMRTSEKFDVITIDPPPPVESSGSGLLYSEEFYRILSARLENGGILQQWLPGCGDIWIGGGDKITLQAAAKALRSVFPFVCVFRSVEGWGFHFLASMQPFDVPDVNDFVARLPPAAAADFVEWSPGKSPAQLYQDLINREIPLEYILTGNVPFSITDDRPLNEYFLVRRLLQRIL